MLLGRLAGSGLISLVVGVGPPRQCPECPCAPSSNLGLLVGRLDARTRTWCCSHLRVLGIPEEPSYAPGLSGVAWGLCRAGGGTGTAACTLTSYRLSSSGLELLGFELFAWLSEAGLSLWKAEYVFTQSQGSGQWVKDQALKIGTFCAGWMSEMGVCSKSGQGNVSWPECGCSGNGDSGVLCRVGGV